MRLTGANTEDFAIVINLPLLANAKQRHEPARAARPFLLAVMVILAFAICPGLAKDQRRLGSVSAA